MTVLIALRVADGVVLAADRAAADTGRELMPGVPFTYPDITKVVSGPRAAAVLGGWARVATPQESVDLLAEVGAAVGSASGGAAAAAAVRDAFDARASAVRDHASVPGEGALDPGRQDVLSVALVGGTSPSGPTLFRVVLPWHGPCTLSEITADVTVYAPTAGAALEAEVELQTVARAPTEQALEAVGTALRRIGVQMPAVVTLDWEHALITSTGPGSLVQHMYQRPPLQRGW